MQMDWAKVLKVAQVMEHRALTIEQIMQRAGVSQRTAYRWLTVLEDRGCTISRERLQGGGWGYRCAGLAPDNIPGQ